MIPSSSDTKWYVSRDIMGSLITILACMHTLLKSSHHARYVRYSTVAEDMDDIMVTRNCRI